MDSMFRSVANVFCNLMRLRSVRFLLVGGINTLLGFGLYVIFLFLGLSYEFAYLFGLVVSVIFGFFAQSCFVFGIRNKYLILRFVLAWILMYFLNVFATEQLILSGFSAYDSGAIIVMPGAAISYLLQKLYVFRILKNN